MNESENQIRAEIQNYIEEGYEPGIIPDILVYKKLIELWSVKGKYLCTLNDIQFVVGLVLNDPKNDFVCMKTQRSVDQSESLVDSVENDLRKTVMDDYIFNLFDEQTVENSLTLLSNLLSENMLKLGNLLANKVLADTIESIYQTADAEINEGTARIYKDVIQMRYMEGYSTAVIKDSLCFKILLMEWLENAWPLTGDEDIDFFYREINVKPDHFRTGLTPRNAEDALVLMEKVISDLQHAEFDETFLTKIKLVTADNANRNMVEMIKEYRNKIGNKLMEETYTSLLIEVITKTSNYDDSNNQ